PASALPLLSTDRLGNGSRRNPQAVDQTREQFERCRGGNQLYNLRISIGGLELREKGVIHILRRQMQPVSAAEPKLLGLGKWPGLEVSLSRCDLRFARTLLTRRQRMARHGIALLQKRRQPRRDQFLVPTRQRAVAQQRLQEPRYAHREGRR